MTENVSERLHIKKSRYEVLRKILPELKRKIEKAKLYGRAVSAKFYSKLSWGASWARNVLGFVNAAGEGQYMPKALLNKQLMVDGYIKSVTDVRNIPWRLENNMRIEQKSATIWRWRWTGTSKAGDWIGVEKGSRSSRRHRGKRDCWRTENGQEFWQCELSDYNPADFAKQKNGSRLWIARRWCCLNRDRLSSPLVSLRHWYMLLHRPAHILVLIVLKSLTASMCTSFWEAWRTQTIQGAFHTRSTLVMITAIRKLEMARRYGLSDFAANIITINLVLALKLELSYEAWPFIQSDSAEGNEVRYSAMTYGKVWTWLWFKSRLDFFRRWLTAVNITN